VQPLEGDAPDQQRVAGRHRLGDRGDLGWLRRWPRAALSGRCPYHHGHVDPGQRIGNLVLTAGLVVLVLSGLGLALVHGGPAFVWLVRVHRLTTYLVTPVVVGHVLVAAGMLPGYRGVWRSMHTRRGVDEQTARRLWPAWTRRRAPGAWSTGRSA
jgi:hypothetical protein